MLEPRTVKGAGASFRYQKVFGEDVFLAAGVVEIPVGGEKPGKFSKDNAYVSRASASCSRPLAEEKKETRATC